MRSTISLLAVAALAALAGGAGAAVDAPTACVVPRVFALSPSAAEARLAAAGCRLGLLTHQHSHARVTRVTGQVPAPGAVLPRQTRISLVVS